MGVRSEKDPMKVSECWLFFWGLIEPLTTLQPLQAGTLNATHNPNFKHLGVESFITSLKNEGTTTACF